jgi:uncharacterized protein (DUF885 family)
VAQLHSALVSVARYLAAIRVHGQGTATEANITDFFMREAYLGRSDAQRESRRVAIDPGVIKYTLGKIEIRKLRDDYRQARGAEFSLKQFHDELLGLGYPPIKIVREALLPEGGGQGPSS